MPIKMTFPPRPKPTDPHWAATWLYPWAERQLKPCPFCGNRWITILSQEPPPGAPKGSEHHFWLVKCSECGGCKKVITNYLRSIVAAWNNRRPPDTSPVATVAEVHGDLEEKRQERNGSQKEVVRPGKRPRRKRAR